MAVHPYHVYDKRNIKLDTSFQFCNIDPKEFRKMNIHFVKWSWVDGAHFGKCFSNRYHFVFRAAKLFFY